MEANITNIFILLIACGACNCIYRNIHPMRRLNSISGLHGMPYNGGNVQRTVYISYSNLCDLNYENTVEDKPEILATVFNHSGLCRITSQENTSTTHYVKEVVREFIYFVGNIGFFKPLDSAHFDQPYRRVVDREKELATSILVNGLNYDARQQFIFYLAIQDYNHTHSEIYKIDVNKSSEDSKPIFEQRQHELTDLAYDWITKNMYINGRSFVLVFNVNKTWSVIEIISNRSDIQSLVVHPNKGYLFFIDSNNTVNENSNVTYAIYRSNLDGSNMIKVSENFNQNLTSLAIDYFTDRLYWALPNSKIIRNTNLDGSDVKDILEKTVKGSSHSISFDKKYVYYVQADKPWIRRFDKANEKDDEDYKLVNWMPMADIKVYDLESQKIREDHPCLNNNGGCQYYCFAIPKDEDKLERICSDKVNEKQ